MNELDIRSSTTEWTKRQADLLLKEYKQCRTEKSRIKVREKLKSFKVRVEYELDVLNKLIEESEDNGTKF